MLPLHGQGTAAVKVITGQAGLLIITKRHVFDKQAK